MSTSRMASILMKCLHWKWKFETWIEKWKKDVLSRDYLSNAQLIITLFYNTFAPSSFNHKVFVIYIFHSPKGFIFPCICLLSCYMRFCYHQIKNLSGAWTIMLRNDMKQQSNLSFSTPHFWESFLSLLWKARHRCLHSNGLWLFLLIAA